MFVALGSLLLVIALRGVFGDLVIVLPLALLGLSVLALILASVTSPYSERGLAEWEQWKSFSQYLTAVTKGREAITRADLFDHYLPYAAALGLAEPWYKFFQKRGEVVAPAWFGAMAANPAAFGAFIAATSASTAGAAGAGAGAAGGGSSGTG
jgi:uncharacterized membrane protein